MRRKESSGHWWFAILVVLLVGAGLYYWRFMREPAPAAPPQAPAGAAAPAPEAAAPPAPALPSAPAYPVEPEARADGEPGEAPAAPAPGDPRDAETFFDGELGRLLGASPLLSWLQIDDFARRVVATVDNLPSRHVAPMVWPLQTTPGQLALARREDGSYLEAANAQRYRPLVQAIAAVDTASAAALYRQAYPLFQRAYEDLGYPGRYFNDRLVQVIDHLLATPDLQDPIAVVLPQVRPAEGAADGTGEAAAPFVRPWVRYEFADPQLEKLSAGQKIMLRMGAANRAVVKAKLREWRAAVTARPHAS